MRLGKVNNKHYEDLQKILDKINNTQDLIIASDKTGNHYLVNSETYKGYIKEEIEKDYKKSTKNATVSKYEKPEHCPESRVGC